MAKLTVRAIEAAKPGQSAYRLAVDSNLSIRVSPDGVKRWLVRYRVRGYQQEVRLPMPFGYGVGFMSLADAVTENNRIQSLARAGIDFQKQAEEEHKAKEALAVAAVAELLPFSAMFSAWLENGVARSDGNAELRRSFDKNVIPLIGAMPVKHVGVDDIRKVLRIVAKRGANRTVVVLLKELRQLFRWGQTEQPWRRLLIEGDPTSSINIETIVSADYDLSNERERILPPDEIRELRDIFAKTTEQYLAAADKRKAVRPLTITTQVGLWICLGTLCRVGELLKAEWKHVDFEKRHWFIPEENVKGRRGKKQALLVCLSDFALNQFQLLQTISGDSKWCFPARDGEGPVSDKKLSKQVGDRQLMFKDRKELKGRRNDNSLVLAGGKNGDWTPHDLRRTGATMMQELKVPLEIIDRCQNHVMPGSKVRRHYLHYEYLPEKREAWERLGARLEHIFAGDNVVMFTQRQQTA